MGRKPKKKDAEVVRQEPRPLEFLRGADKDFRDVPPDVQDVFVLALELARTGGKSDAAKPLKGFQGAGVLEIVEDFDTDTYRAVYTVRFAKAVYVLHVFQKKSSQGIKTSKRDLDLIDSRLKLAKQHYEAKYKDDPSTN